LADYEQLEKNSTNQDHKPCRHIMNDSACE
jgi:hypothetical protein